MKADYKINHSASHVLACAVLKLFPNTKLGFGPATEEGFYYDFQFENPLSENDLIKIEKQMKKIISGGYKVAQVSDFKFNNQPFKKELLKELKDQNQTITYYGLINPSNKESVFTDLCKGNHAHSVSEIKHFKLLSLAGAYWRGNSDNPQLTRIYGTAWKTKDELDNFLQLIKERKERDHRKIGKEMNLFTFDQKAGQGFPIWLQDGMIIKNTLQNYIRKMERKYGFEEVQTPSFGEKSLYEISGHLDHYQEDMFPILKLENENLVMRPMSCPHHVLIYLKKRHSYRDLPIRISEHAKLYRYEKSGALTGLERVRSMELTDAHIFARQDQIIEEFKKCYQLIQEVLEHFHIKIDYVSLSLRDENDKDKYFDDDNMWNKAEKDLKQVLEQLKIPYKEMKGEAAFYGPKIDIQVKTAIGHDITLSTLQLDFLLPQRFNLSYIDNNEQKQVPVLIHRGLIGTYERFISILLEQTKGDLPFWLAPKQIVLIPINNEKHLLYCQELFKAFLKADLRVTIDQRNERLSKKILEAQTTKTKYQIVIGDQELQNKNLNIRKYGSQKKSQLSLSEFLQKLKVQ